MKCPRCKHIPKAGTIIQITNDKVFCPKCEIYSPSEEWIEAQDDSKDYRPNHYEKGHDTFAWAEHKFDLETNLNICRFNIHRYNDRDKGQDVEDFEKIIAYAQRALELIKEDKMEVTGL